MYNRFHKYAQKYIYSNMVPNKQKELNVNNGIENKVQYSSAKRKICAYCDSK